MVMKLNLLPEDCIARVLSQTSPRDACRSSLVSSEVREAADSDVLWGKFLPADYEDTLSRLMFPLFYKSKKELFLKLTVPLLIDGGTKTFCIDRANGKKCYILNARELQITWSTNSLYWSWKPFYQSRFAEVTELVMVSWLEIWGSMNTRMLSPNTTYGAYLILQFTKRTFGFDKIGCVVSVEVGNYQSQRTIHLVENEGKCSRGRGDGWMEIELGEFYNDASAERQVKMSLKEVNGEQLKGGLVVEGIELRPK